MMYRTQNEYLSKWSIFSLYSCILCMGKYCRRISIVDVWHVYKTIPSIVIVAVGQYKCTVLQMSNLP